MQWESRRRTDEINELQNALSETNIALNQERKSNINLTGEFEILKRKHNQNKTKKLVFFQRSFFKNFFLNFFYCKINNSENERRQKKTYANAQLGGANRANDKALFRQKT